MSEMKKIMENWRGFKSSNLITEKEEKSFLDKAGDFLGKLLGGYGEAETTLAKSSEAALIGTKDKILKQIEKKALDFKMPVHMRAFAKFLLGSETVFTEKNLTKREIEALERSVIMLGSVEGLTSKEFKAFNAKKVDSRLRLGGSKRISYGHWMNLSRRNDPEGFKVYSRLKRKKDRKRKTMNIPQKKSIFSSEVFNSFQRFLGNARYTVDRSGNVTISDFYDFNNAKAKENFDELWFDIKNVLTPSMHGGDDMYQAIRRMAPYRQTATGYKGFKVQITFKLSDATTNSLAALDSQQKDFQISSGYQKNNASYATTP